MTTTPMNEYMSELPALFRQAATAQALDLADSVAELRATFDGSDTSGRERLLFDKLASAALYATTSAADRCAILCGVQAPPEDGLPPWLNASTYHCVAQFNSVLDLLLKARLSSEKFNRSLRNLHLSTVHAHDDVLRACFAARPDAWERRVANLAGGPAALAQAAWGWVQAGSHEPLASVESSARRQPPGGFEFAIGAQPVSPICFDDGGSMRIQSLLIPSKNPESGAGMTPEEAHQWAEAHNFNHGKIDSSGQYHRLRQFDPGLGTTHRTITLDKKKNIKAVVAKVKRAAFRQWDLADVQEYDDFDLQQLEPYEAEEILDQLGDELPDRLVDKIERLADSGTFSEDLTPVSFGVSPWRNPGNAPLLLPGNLTAGLRLLMARPAISSLTNMEPGEPGLGNPQQLLQAAANMVLSARMGGATSKQLYCQNGSYSPARDALHESLIEQALDLAGNPANRAERPIATLLMGAPAIGKTSKHSLLMPPGAREWYSPHSRGQAVSADANLLMEWFPEYLGWNAPLLAAEADDLFGSLVGNAISRRFNLFIEHPGVDLENAARLLDKLWASGYKIHLSHLSPGSPQEAVDRATARFLDNPFGLTEPMLPPARFVEPELVRAALEQSDANYLELRDHPAVYSHASYRNAGLPDAGVVCVDCSEQF